MITPNSNESFNKVIFTAMARENFFLREHIIKFILQLGHTPTSAFMMFSYFLLDTIERNSLIAANNELIKRSDELWVFGKISNGVEQEIKIAKKLKKPVRYFVCKMPSCAFCEITKKQAEHTNY